MSLDLDTLISTREHLHQLAEHVVSPARYEKTGRIGLRPHPGGLRTPAFGDRDTVVCIELDDLVVVTADGTRRQHVTTLAKAAEFVGVRPGAPSEVYTPATECNLRESMTLDREAMQALADWYALGAEALHQLSDELAELHPSESQLWPEHLDLAVTVGAVNYGFSPGDDRIPEPYVYVGPHDGPPRRDDFWNTPFGATRTHDVVRSVEAALDFFRQAQAELAPTPATTERTTP